MSNPGSSARPLPRDASPSRSRPLDRSVPGGSVPPPTDGAASPPPPEGTASPPDHTAPPAADGAADPTDPDAGARAEGVGGTALPSRSRFELAPQTIFCLATGESVRYWGSAACAARTWGDPGVGFRTTAELDLRGCRGLGLVRGRRYEFSTAPPVTLETAPPYPTSHLIQGRAAVRTQPGGACAAAYVATLRIGADGTVRLLGFEIRAIERDRSG